MPVYIHEEDAFEKMVAVEGESWRRDVEGFGPHGFKAFLDTWNEMKPCLDEMREESDWGEVKSYDISTEGGDGAIYGAGGFNRYRVSYEGEIIFIRSMAGRVEYIAKAEAQGFRVF